MIKKQLIILTSTLILISSCVTIDYGYFRYFKEGFFTNNEINTLDVKKNTPYSFIKAYYGKNQAILVLSKIDKNNVYHWIGENSYEQIKTFKGLIIQTSGFGFGNLSLYNSDLAELFSAFPIKDFEVHTYIDDPKLVHANAKYEVRSTQDDECTKIVYSKIIESIKFQNDDEFCFNNNGLVAYSKQKFSNLHKEIHIEFYYQF